MRTLLRYSLVVLAVALVIAIAVMNLWLGMRHKYAGLGLVIGAGGIILGLSYLVLRFASRRPRDEFGPAEEERWPVLTGERSFIIVAIAVVCVLTSTTLVFKADFTMILVTLAVLAALVGGLIILYTLFRLLTAWIRRRPTDRMVIGQIATVVRQNLPLATGLALAAQSERGAARTHLRRIAHLLAQGAPLSEAVRRGFPDCPSLPLSLIIAGEQAGQLPAALEQAEQYLIDQARRRDRVDVSVWPYALCMLLCTTLVVSGVMVAIVPKFKEIFKDFGTELPGALIFTMSFCEFMVDSGLLLILTILFIIAAPVSAYLSYRPRRLPEPSATSRAADWIRWHTPWWKQMELSSGLAAVLRIILIGVRAGMNLAPAARLAATIDVNSQLRSRVGRFADLLSSGTNSRAAAREAGLGEVTAIALASGERSGDIQAGLRFAADYHDNLVNRFWIVMRNLAWPVATLVMGTIVGIVVLALFLPLVKLINSVSSGGW